MLPLIALSPASRAEVFEAPPARPPTANRPVASCPRAVSRSVRRCGCGRRAACLRADNGTALLAGDYENRFRLARMNGQRKTEIRRQTFGDFIPSLAAFGWQSAGA